MKCVFTLVVSAAAVASGAHVPTKVSQDLHKLLADIESSFELTDSAKTAAEEKLIDFRQMLEKEGTCPDSGTLACCKGKTHGSYAYGGGRKIGDKCGGEALTASSICCPANADGSGSCGIKKAQSC